jgi:hypothetical protein
MSAFGTLRRLQPPPNAALSLYVAIAAAYRRAAHGAKSVALNQARDDGNEHQTECPARESYKPCQ